MDLKNYLKKLAIDDRRKLAESGRTSLGQLMNVAYGYRSCSAELAVAIEQATGGVVSRQDLCPEKWQSIWPELVKQAA
jgi:DNA-binding transcriptional regulator YdaS (Cro superfamily)